MSKHRHKRRKKWKKKWRRWKRYRNYHHLVPRCRGGSDEPSNLLLIKADRHDLWHRIFGVRTLDEVIKLLLRLKRMKEGGQNENKYFEADGFRNP